MEYREMMGYALFAEILCLFAAFVGTGVVRTIFAVLAFALLIIVVELVRLDNKE